MSLHEETQQRVILKRGKTTRVSFADNETIENVKNTQINDTNFKKLINLNQNIQLDKTKKNNIILQSKNESELVKSFDEIFLLKSSQDKIKKKELQDAEIFEIENKARIKSAMNKKRKKSVETEKLKIEEIIRKRFNQNESDRNRVKQTEKLPKMIFSNESNNSNGDENFTSKSVYLPLLRYNKHENDLPYKTHLLDKIKLHDPSSRSSLANYEEDRIKADGELKINNNIKEKRITDETTRKIAEIKAEKVYFLI
jgi:hypothetical protein